MTHDRSDWRFLSNHAIVLLAMARQPDVRIHELAATVGITERACQKIVNDLRAAGYVSARRVGRRNVYTVDRALPMRHPLLRRKQVTNLLELWNANGGATSLRPEPAAQDLDPLVVNDWRRRVGEMYAALRGAPDSKVASKTWRRVRDELFARHPATPLPADARAAFHGVPYYEYDASFRVLATVVPGNGEQLDLAASDGGTYRFVPFGRAVFRLHGEEQQLDLFWLLGYGGGVFLPFADATSGRATYGAGRYLLDTVKGADLGEVDGKLVLDFNFAYNPSCSYDPHWSCPLPPPGNRLALGVEAGERYDTPSY